MVLTKKLQVVVLGLLIAAVAPLDAAEKAGEWTYQPEMTIKRLWDYVIVGDRAVGARFLSSHGLSWRDGRQAFVMYFRLQFDLYRCIEFFDASMRPTRNMCYRLESRSE